MQKVHTLKPLLAGRASSAGAQLALTVLGVPFDRKVGGDGLAVLLAVAGKDIAVGRDGYVDAGDFRSAVAKALSDEATLI